MAQTDRQADPIRPGAGLRRLRRGDFSSSAAATPTVLTRTLFHTMLRTEIERATSNDSTVLLARVSIRPLPGRGTDLRGRELPAELVERLAAAHEQTHVAALGSKQLILAVPALDRATSGEQVIGDLLHALTAPVVVDGLPHHLGPRLGAAMLDDDNSTIELLQEGTQLALDETDPDRPAMMFHPFQRVRDNLRVNLSADLRTAVVDGDIEAEVEPVYELETRDVVAYQALARWERPNHGVVPAPEFVQLAAELGVEHVLQRQVLDKALALLPGPTGRRATDPTPDRLTLWLTVSPNQLIHPEFASMIADTSAAHSHVEIGLELKPMPSAKDDDVVAVLRGLIGTGVRVAVGDFGIGNANLTTLRSLGCDSVKLDRSLTASVATNSTAASIVSALITIAAELGLETTAEDIETADQLAALRRMGCHLGQGDHIAEATTKPPDNRDND